MNFKKLEEVCVPKRPIYKTPSQFLPKYYRMRDTCTSSQPIFQTLQSPILDIFVQSILLIDGAEF